MQTLKIFNECTTLKNVFVVTCRLLDLWKMWKQAPKLLWGSTGVDGVLNLWYEISLYSLAFSYKTNTSIQGNSIKELNSISTH